VSRFSEHWLALREGADANARATALLPALRLWLHAQLPANDTTPKVANILDLGCGTGSNLRWLSPRLAKPQHWTLLDNDPQLLAQADLALQHWTGLPVQSGDGNLLQLNNGVSATLTRADLDRQIPSLDEFHLLSASALLDLVSRRWLSTLVEQAAQRDIGLLFALNYDGRMRFTPAHPADARIRDALNRDQLTDKGFGPALGPGCVAALHSACLTHGYRIGQWRSDWHLGADEHALHLQLVDDFASIAERQMGPAVADPGAILTWRRWRRAHIDESTLRIGHVDVLALPGKRHRLSATCVEPK
jgi:SAM-dependent methyltransferase